MDTSRCLAIPFFLLLLGASPVTGSEPEQPRKLVVATRHTPPFAVRGADGSWSGLSIELWRSIARELQLQYEFREMTLPEMLQGLEDGSVDVAAAALTMTASREKKMDFSHPFHTSGLGMAVTSNQQNTWTDVLTRLFSWTLVKFTAGILVLMFLSGVLVFFFERRTNPEQFAQSWFRGLMDGIWWAAVTMTTVGYGDKVPRTIAGRLLALFWMFLGVLLIAGFTGAVSAALTTSQIREPFRGPEDLPHARVASVEGSTAQEYLQSEHLAFSGYSEAKIALQALTRGEKDVVVYDAPILRYLAYRDFAGSIQVLPRTLEVQQYAFAFPSGSPLRERCNQVLLGIVRSPRWDDRVEQYLGRR